MACIRDTKQRIWFFGKRLARNGKSMRQGSLTSLYLVFCKFLCKLREKKFKEPKWQVSTTIGSAIIGIYLSTSSSLTALEKSGYSGVDQAAFNVSYNAAKPHRTQLDEDFTVGRAHYPCLRTFSTRTKLCYAFGSRRPHQQEESQYVCALGLYVETLLISICILALFTLSTIIQR